MSAIAATKPADTEYANYYSKYVSLVADGDIVGTLEKQLQNTSSFLRGLSAEQADYRYAPDKWSIKEVLGHIIDTERIFAYRVLRFARNDQTELSGFEQDGYIPAGNFGRREWSDLIDEFEAVRRANLYLLRNLDDHAWQRKGTASQNPVTVRALAYIMAGHELHHLNVIKTKYLR